MRWQGGYPKQDKMRVSNMAVELPLDVLAGPTFDGLDLITGGGEFAANQKSFQLWSLLLNHGYRVAPTASSDACFDRPGGAVPGAARLYTFIEGGFTVAAAARGGRPRPEVRDHGTAVGRIGGRPAAGFEPVTLGPFFDHSALVEMVTRLEDNDLLDWRTFERIQTLLGDVRLTFRLTEARPGEKAMCAIRWLCVAKTASVY